MTDSHSDPGGVGHPDEARLRMLAYQHAREMHVDLAPENEFLTSEGGHIFTDAPGSGFETCPHPDCVLVRQPVPPPGAVPATPQIDGTCRNGAPHYCPNCDNSFIWNHPVAAVPAAQDARQRSILVDRDAALRQELRAYLDTLTITGDNIGDIRRSLFLPWESSWNGWVRDDTAEREGRASLRASHPSRQEPPQ